MACSNDHSEISICNHNNRPQCSCGKFFCDECLDEMGYDYFDGENYQYCDHCSVVGCHYERSNEELINDPDFKCRMFFHIQRDHSLSEYTEKNTLLCHNCIFSLFTGETSDASDGWISINDLNIINRLCSKNDTPDKVAKYASL